jgi:ribose transport system substrate-binding protein
MCLASIQREAAQYPEIEELIILDGQNKVDKQVNDIYSLIAQEVDVILTIANSGTAVAPVLKEATEKGILTVPFNLPVEGTDYVTYVGTNPSVKCKRLGKGLRDALDKDSGIVALGGIPGNSYTAVCWGAAKPIITEMGIEVLAYRDAYWEESRAKSIMTDLIAAYPDIDGIWADGGQVACGALKALLSSNKPLIPACGDDYNGVLRLYDTYKDKYPEFTFISISEPTWESSIALRTAIEILRGEKKQVHQNLFIRPLAITPENYKNYYRPDLPDAVFVDTELSNEKLKQIFGVSE